MMIYGLNNYSINFFLFEIKDMIYGMKKRQMISFQKCFIWWIKEYILIYYNYQK